MKSMLSLLMFVLVAFASCSKDDSTSQLMPDIKPTGTTAVVGYKDCVVFRFEDNETTVTETKALVYGYKYETLQLVAANKTDTLKVTIQIADSMRVGMYQIQDEFFDTYYSKAGVRFVNERSYLNIDKHENGVIDFRFNGVLHQNTKEAQKLSFSQVYIHSPVKYK